MVSLSGGPLRALDGWHSVSVDNEGGEGDQKSGIRLRAVTRDVIYIFHGRRKAVAYSFLLLTPRPHPLSLNHRKSESLLRLLVMR